ncbi:phage tail protein [Paraburkholderia sp. J11-2]|uniref:phage tail protein n=1 Tax=Paraburkholderia sp. J11-2 TaxID=2805431 RepID=UPI002AB67302|nr:phage tail protein [Paraburkholderia sp. J11-2]
MAGSSTIENKSVPEIALRLQDSGYGKPPPMVWGRTRIQPNLIWFGDFTAIPHTTSQSAGGKAGGTTMKNTSYTYTVAAMLALANQIEGVGKVWAGKSVYTPAALNLTIFRGADDQQPWGYLVTKHPDAALNYPRLSYVASGAYDLGDSSSLPQHTFEVQGLGRFAPDIPDATPLRIVTDMLTDPAGGALFPAEHIGDMTAFDDYSVAMGLFMSPALVDQVAAVDALAHIAELTGSAWVDSNGQIRLVPLTTVPVAGNGRVYVPDLEPVFRLTDDDYLDTDGNGEPVLCRRVFDTDAYNELPLAFSDRDNDYNTSVFTAKDQTNIDQNGERPAQRLDGGWICTAAAAENAAYLKLGRMLYGRNEYTFSLPPKYLTLECGDLLAMNDRNLGMVDELVRVTQIDIAADRRMDLTAEEVTIGYGAPVAYGTQAALGYRVNFGASGASVSDPVIFNAPQSLTDGKQEVWIAAAGSTSDWSGCDVWVSLNGQGYTNIGAVTAPAGYGMLVSAVGPDANALDIDMSLSGGTLESGDAEHDTTLSWLGGELVSYERATLQSDKSYSLEGVLRARQRTVEAEHAESTRFVRIDSAIFRYRVPDSYLGTEVYIKFTSRNAVGGATEALADVDAYVHLLESAQTLPGGVLQLILLDAVGGDHFRVGWAAQSGAAYQVQLRSAGGIVRSTATTLNEWTYSASDAASDGGAHRAYVVTVTPENDIGTGEASSLAVSIPAPPAPSAIREADGVLSWSVVPDASVAGYMAWLATVPNFDPRRGEGILIYDGPDTQVQLSGVTPGMTYYARVASYDGWSKDVADLKLSFVFEFVA